MLFKKGLNNNDWSIVLGKIKSANLEQLTFLKTAIDNEIIKLKGQ